MIGVFKACFPPLWFVDSKKTVHMRFNSGKFNRMKSSISSTVACILWGAEYTAEATECILEAVHRAGCHCLSSIDRTFGGLSRGSTSERSFPFIRRSLMGGNLLFLDYEELSWILECLPAMESSSIIESLARFWNAKITLAVLNCQSYRRSWR